MSHVTVSHVTVSHVTVSHVTVSHVTVSHVTVSHVTVSQVTVSQVTVCVMRHIPFNCDMSQVTFNPKKNLVDQCATTRYTISKIGQKVK